MHYWSDIVSAVRAQAAARIVSWAEAWSAPGEQPGRRVLVLGARSGVVAARLSRSGIRVLHLAPMPEAGTAVPRAFAPLEQPGGAASRAVCRGPLAEPPLREDSPFAAAIALEELEDLSAEKREEAFTRLSGLDTEWLVLGARVSVRGRRLVETALPEDLRTTVDSVTLLRELHLTTPFRLQRREHFCRRRFALDLWSLRRS